MYFLIDIDGTIASINHLHFMQNCNKRLQLGIAAERLSALSFDDFLAQPELIACQQRLGKQRFEQTMRLLQFDQDTLLHYLPVDGAHEAIAKLSEFGSIAYYTARYVTYNGNNPSTKQATECFNEQMYHATQRWLAQHHFPAADQVVCCESIHGKLQRIAHLIQQEMQPVILIDNQYMDVLTAELTSAEDALLSASFTLCAFYTAAIPFQTKWRTIAMPTWHHVESLLTSLESLQLR